MQSQPAFDSSFIGIYRENVDFFYLTFSKMFKTLRTS